MDTTDPETLDYTDVALIRVSNSAYLEHEESHTFSILLLVVNDPTKIELWETNILPLLKDLGILSIDVTTEFETQAQKPRTIKTITFTKSC